MKNKKSGSAGKVLYAQAVYDSAEINAVVDVLKHPTKIGGGVAVKEFEQKIAGLFGKKYGVMVNSGSSANLIALEVLNLPAGSEVITPVLTFGTTLSPIIQKGLTPTFVDVKPGTYTIDIDKIESMITPKTQVLMIPSLFGNVPDMIRLRKIADKYDLWLIEDSCDTLGARFAGKPTGYYSDISTTSFYASHVITAAGGGGMACFHDPNLARKAKIISCWGRESTLFGLHEQSEDIRKRFAGRIEGRVYDAKFIFSEVGYNFQVPEMFGAFGLEQLKKFPEFARRRKKNFKELLAFFAKYEDLFVLPKQTPRSETNWLAFPLTIRENANFSRYDLAKYLEEHGIQTRPIFTGNALKQPAFRKLKRVKVDTKGYPVADDITLNGFVIGCHHGLTQKDIA
ncbi:MAG: aminotransferase class I/II-fold pyridoxal phosphate-dependent enzyme, partial [Patescibacteria group bacterium]|nr:aminotransferase class I/II-fold pyridoxal phosphate-dependent enzyme [Patescibacteria group bacterium]